MKRFLFINQYYWPDEAGTSQFLQDLAEDLVRNGHHVTVLCGRSCYSCKEKLHAGHFEHNGVHIERVGGTDLGRIRSAWRMSDIISFMWQARSRLHQLPHHDAVIAMTSPPMVGRLAIPFCRKHKVPLTLWVQDIYPELAERFGALKNSVIRSWMYRQARAIYRFSSKIVVLGDDMYQTLTRYPETNGKIFIIPNWAVLEEIPCTSVLENPFRFQQGWDRDYVLMYSGNLGVAHELDAMAQLIVLLHKESTSFRFVLVGDHARHKTFAKQLQKAGVKRITTLPFQSRENLGLVLGAADAHLVSQKPDADGLLVPSKFYSAIASGRPVIFIGSRTCQVGRNIIESQLGTVLPPNQVSVGIRQTMELLRKAQNEKGAVPYFRDWARVNAARSIRTAQLQALLEM